MSAAWIDDLPSKLKDQVRALVAEHPNSEPVLLQLASHYGCVVPNKRKKPNLGKVQQTPKKLPGNNSVKPEPNNTGVASGGPIKTEMLSQNVLNITSPIKADETIFEMTGLSFLSPLRRKLNLLFHLHMSENDKPLPVLSVVAPATNIPEISVTNLHSAIKLCLIIPILGNSTVSTKKDTVMMSLWLDDSAATSAGKNDPIICTFNLDLVKKQLMADGKIPAHAEAQVLLASSTSDAIKPINELIIDFLRRQFELCGVKLISFLPSAMPGKNELNMNDDNVICVSHISDTHNDLVMAGAYKGSKEGALLLASASSDSAYLIFGFKKPVLIMDFTSLKAVSYSNITRFTFSMMVTSVNKDGNEELYEFGMIDQKAFQAIDEFVKRKNIEDNSFDEKHREKRADTKTDASKSDAVGSLGDAGMAGSDEEDGTYMGAVEEDGSGSEVDEDYNSNAENGEDSGSDTSGSDTSGSEDDSEDDSGSDNEETNNDEVSNVNSGHLE
ncbi:Rtt106-domain-containing protein [Metschnikowia bicuspidata var. bicuspidata NRRL YB-4993]|uniref:Histone chaperone RTT106 n=1 Tax=Metschnikowia bicuspidata var. bicuspidata NRRL YB-4993 TaxID=869754 RepID=A0A1A0HE56_9ASCO|nr:Rtt106-domain-containing protein [Metschnikowia bicuspidata var. bicuspidata NRRL YB-4993]OBA22276.1 Rtt106-domain-containing protein [Metschnikowia bicuspidata var. bicuspidata NRRL YB-4993]